MTIFDSIGIYIKAATHRVFLWWTGWRQPVKLGVILLIIGLLLALVEEFSIGGVW